MALGFRHGTRDGLPGPGSSPVAGPGRCGDRSRLTARAGTSVDPRLPRSTRPGRRSRGRTARNRAIMTQLPVTPANLPVQLLGHGDELGDPQRLDDQGDRRA